MWGYCAGCKYAKACRGGCSQMAHVLFNRNGNNPFCHYRTLELAGRERVVLSTPGQGKLLDHGVFDLVQEPLETAWPTEDAHHFTYERVPWSSGWEPFALPG